MVILLKEMHMRLGCTVQKGTKGEKLFMSRKV